MIRNGLRAISAAFALLAITGSLFSCSNTENARVQDASNKPDKGLSSEVIHNPKTAEQGDQAAATGAQAPVMTFERDKWDFGDIIQGEQVEYAFRFTNTGTSPLIITSAKGSCGCTVPEYPKEPIAPGESSYLRVTYDSNGRQDRFDKTVTITANTVPNTNQLFISGNVIVPGS
jgi:hypothetical protein